MCFLPPAQTVSLIQTLGDVFMPPGNPHLIITGVNKSQTGVYIATLFFPSCYSEQVIFKRKVFFDIFHIELQT